jgi:hypothetical protein
MKKQIAIIFLAWFGASAFAQWDAFLGGAAQSASDQLEQKMRRESDLDQQKALMDRQHELEMHRIREEYRLRAEEQDRNRRSGVDRPTANQKNEQSVVSQIEAVHPGWQTLVRSSDFTNWMRRQPNSIRALANSERVSDAILMVDLYKKDRN